VVKKKKVFIKNFIWFSKNICIIYKKLEDKENKENAGGAHGHSHAHGNGQAHSHGKAENKEQKK